MDGAPMERRPVGPPWSISAVNRMVFPVTVNGQPGHSPGGCRNRARVVPPATPVLAFVTNVPCQGGAV